jgi:hypothetical protein
MRTTSARRAYLREMSRQAGRRWAVWRREGRRREWWWCISCWAGGARCGGGVGMAGMLFPRPAPTPSKTCTTALLRVADTGNAVVISAHMAITLQAAHCSVRSQKRVQGCRPRRPFRPPTRGISMLGLHEHPELPSPAPRPEIRICTLRALHTRPHFPNNSTDYASDSARCLSLTALFSVARIDR